MKQVTVVYWSGTGNTELMAKAVAEGAKSAGATVKLLSVEDASPEEVLAADAIALGCPAMGDEVLEESFMDPFVEALEGRGIEGAALALFGSYDWGDGRWMREWEERATEHKAKVAGTLIIHNTPDEEGLAECRTLGEKLAAQ